MYALKSTFGRKAYSYPHFGYCWMKIIPKIYIILGKYCRPKNIGEKGFKLTKYTSFRHCTKSDKLPAPPPPDLFYDHI